jgi:hypothetical protein
MKNYERQTGPLEFAKRLYVFINILECTDNEV